MQAVFNGVDRSSGGYLFEPQELTDTAASLDGRDPSGLLQRGLDIRHAADQSSSTTAAGGCGVGSHRAAK